MSVRGSRAAAAALVVLFSLSVFAETAVEPQAGPSDVSEAAPSTALSIAPGALPPGFENKKRENPFRRFEIIALGAFPIMLFYTDIGFDIHNYISNGFDYRYAPWPFKNSSYSIEPDEGELYLRIGVAAGISFVFAGVDAAIRAIRAKKAEARSAPQR